MRSTKSATPVLQSASLTVALASSTQSAPPVSQWRRNHSTVAGLPCSKSLGAVWKTTWADAMARSDVVVWVQRWTFVGSLSNWPSLASFLTVSPGSPFLSVS